MTHITWVKFNKSILIQREDKEDLILSVGDCITFDFMVHKRPPNDCCIVKHFTGFQTEVGPVGITYLPWRHEENRWATEQWTLRGDTRHIICYPCGAGHYGFTCNWDTFRMVDEIDHPTFQTFVRELKHSTE